MPFWLFYYHIVWATRFRQPAITPLLEPLIYEAIRHKSNALKAPILALNGVADHVHVAVSIPPAIAVAKWVSDVKAYSSREVNLLLPDAETKFQWQRGYSAFTFGTSRKQYALDYIRRQKEHHAHGTIEPGLERTPDEE
jgi:putative transposase